MSKLKAIVFGFLMLLLAGTFILAQLPSGKFEGRVTDDQENALPGVTVQATSPKMVGKASAVTDANGEFRLFGIPSGTYELTFSLQGFMKLIRKDIIMQLSQTIELNVTLEPAALEESITVVGQSPLIDVKSTVKSSTMAKEMFMSLPRNRDFDGLISTVPGVQYDVFASGLQVDGATSSENMWYMDGADITQIHVGTRAQSAVMEMVEEVKVTASGYEAQYGGSLGGVVNVITRSGGNTFHGDILGYYNSNSRMMQGKARQYLRQNPFNDNLYEYVNDDDLYFDAGKKRDPYYRLEGVFTLGGYIIRDKLWFFGSLNPVYSQTKAPRYFLPDTETITDFYNKNWNYNAQVKFTAAPVSRLRISLSWVNNFSKYRGAIPDINGTDTPDYAWGKQGFDYPNMSAAGTLDYNVGNNFLISARLGWSMQNTQNQQLKPPGTNYYMVWSNSIYADQYAALGKSDLVHYRDWSNWGGGWWNSLDTAKYKLQKYSANLDLSYYLSAGGDHALKAGFQLIRNAEDVKSICDHPWAWLFWGESTTLPSTGEPVSGTYGHYEVESSWTSPEGYLWKVSRNNWALYLQDSWTIGRKLTINAGIRTEDEYIPAFTKETQQPGYRDKPIHFRFGQKMAPRIGLIYDVFGDSSLKVFSSFGIYYDVMKLYLAEGAFGGFKWKTDYYELNTLDWTVIAASGQIDDRPSQEAGGRYIGTMDWRIPSWNTVDPNLKPVAQREISLGLEKKLLENISLRIRGVQKHLIRTIEDTGVETPQGEMYYDTNPGYGWSLHIENGGKFLNRYWETPKARREYWGLNIELEKRFSNNWQGGINYTLSRITGNYGGLSSTDEWWHGGGRDSPNVERYFDLWFMAFDMKGKKLDGVLPQDRTHYIKAYGSYAFPFGLTVGITAYGRSGLPMSTMLNINYTYVYPNNHNDLGRLSWTFWSDVYLEYALKIKGKYSASINLQINNWTNTHTWQRLNQYPNRNQVFAEDDQILAKTYDWQAAVLDANPDPSFKMPLWQFDAWTARLGARFSF
jgi:hypothetical protein